MAATLVFPTGVATIHLSWNAGWRKVRYSLHGRGGAIEVDDDEILVAKMQRAQGPDIGKGAVMWETDKYVLASDWMDSSHFSWFTSLWEKFKQAIQNGEFNSKDLNDSLVCVAAICAAYESAKRGGQETLIPPIFE